MEQIVLLIQVNSQTNLTLSPVVFIWEGREGKNGALMNTAIQTASGF